MKQTEFEFSDGRQKEKGENLSELLGFNRCNPFECGDEQAFSKRLETMTRFDMDELAYRVGLNPASDETNLKRDLKNQFKSFLNQTQSNASVSRVQSVDPSSSKYKELKKLLSV